MRLPEKDGPDSTYEIVIHGELGDRWSRWLHGLARTAEVREGPSQVTVLTVRVRDQAALRGVLNQLWDLNFTLIGVRRIQSRPTKEGDHDG